MWQLVKSEKIGRSQAMRKAWILCTTLERGCSYRCNMFSPFSIDIVCKSEYIGTVEILPEGFVSGRNRKNFRKICKNRHEALKFAFTIEKHVASSQLPLL